MRELGSGDILYILGAIRWTLLLSLVAFAGGAAGGVLVALARTGRFRWLRLAAAGFIKVFQGTPLLMQLFLAFFAPGIFGIDVDPWAAAALGLPYWPTMALIVAPQAVRIAIPPTVGFLVQLIKGTSLASIIGFVELTRAAQIINNATFHPFTIFGMVALAYFAICWPLSIYSRRMERRLAVAARR